MKERKTLTWNSEIFCMAHMLMCQQKRLFKFVKTDLRALTNQQELEDNLLLT